MQTCAGCGNHYDKCFSIKMNDQEYIFDSFECAIQKLAPVCSHCECKIIGHGVEKNGNYFCCVHCAKSTGGTELKDRK